MKIGIIGAMPAEINLLEAAIQTKKSEQFGGRVFHQGHFENHAVTVVFSRWGKVAASATTTILLHRYQVDFIIFTGVAGAAVSYLNIGDIVIGKSLYQHDMNASPIFPRYEIPLLGITLFKPRKNEIATAKLAAQQFLSQINQYIPKKILQHFSIQRPHVHTGTIASGDQFITNAIEHNDLNLPNEQVMAVEMEGAAVAQVCEEHQVPYLIMRTISDKANHQAAFDFQAFTDNIASHYSYGFIKELLNCK